MDGRNVVYYWIFKPLFFTECFKSKNDSAFKLRSAEVNAVRPTILS